MPFDIDKYVKDDNSFKFNFRFPKFKLPKIKLPKFNYEDKEPKGIKKGLRRLIIVFISLTTLCLAIFYISNGFIFDNTKFVTSIEIGEKKIDIVDFGNLLLKEDKDLPLLFSDFECHPYKQKCIFIGDTTSKGTILENGKDYIIEILDPKKQKYAFSISMPSPLKYFSWQLFDFLKIIFFAILSYLLYLLLGFVMSWVISGFNFNLDKIKTPKLTFNKNMTIIFVVLIFAGAYIYVENSKIAYKEKLRKEEIEKKEALQKALDNCLSEAEDNYFSNWNSQCKSIGRKNDCALPAYRADQVEKWRADAKKECMDKFKNEGFKE